MSSFDAIIQAARGRKVPSSKGVAAQAKTVKLGETEAKNGSPSINIQPAEILLSRILDREMNTRELSQSHVLALAESIAVLGLLEPLVVDIHARLLAGGHRLAAIRLVKIQHPRAYREHFPKNLIPVRVISLDADAEPDRALQIEVAENEHRRDYTPAEVRALADRLRAAGYIDQPGRPAKGTKALRPALEVIIGKSLRTVQRYLNQEEEKPRQNVIVSEKKLLQQTLKQLKAWESLVTEADTPKRRSLAKQLPKLMTLLESAISEIQD